MVTGHTDFHVTCIFDTSIKPIRILVVSVFVRNFVSFIPILYTVILLYKLILSELWKDDTINKPVSLHLKHNCSMDIRSFNWDYGVRIWFFWCFFLVLSDISTPQQFAKYKVFVNVLFSFVEFFYQNHDVRNNHNLNTFVNKKISQFIYSTQYE